MRLLAAFLAICVASVCLPARIALVPLDDRPATGQFAQMIGAIGNVRVELPPAEALGRFTKPGNPRAVLEWLQSLDLKSYEAVIVNTEMVAYGGLVASRLDDASLSAAKARLAILADIRRTCPEVPFFLFSTITRVMPTATLETAPWRDALGNYVTLRQMAQAGVPTSPAVLRKARARATPKRIEAYDRMRQRNEAVLAQLVSETASGVYDYLVIGQDDAAAHGPHVPEAARLKRQVEKAGIGGKVYFCEGIDQHSNILVSRAVLKKIGWTPRVKVIYSDEEGRHKLAEYESKPLDRSLEDQLIASGARPATDGVQPDYLLFLNTPKPRASAFGPFVSTLQASVDAGLPCAVADVNLGEQGIADERLFRSIWDGTRAPRLLAYAGWNTAGNTMGTTVPAANLAALARHQNLGEQAETARLAFLLHRYANDFAYHRLVRPIAYNLIEELQPRKPNFEVHGEALTMADSFVRRAMVAYVERYFREKFEGVELAKGGRRAALGPIRAFLPWPRAYEVRLELSVLPDVESQGTVNLLPRSGISLSQGL